MAENIGYLQSDSSKNGDEQYTPSYAVRPLLEFIPDNKIIWCPFDKEWSAFVSVLENNGNKVIYSHIDYGQNFFDYEPQKWDILVSNPPFSKKDAVLRRAYELNKPFALFLPANSIQGKTRFEIFKNDVQMLCFDKRIDFMNPKHMDSPVKGTPFGSAYFCRGLLPTRLELRRLDKKAYNIASVLVSSQ